MIKAAMDLAGFKGGKVRPPLIDLSVEDRADLEGLMSRTGLLRAGTVMA
jgi:dihydrodipicolinate synthase/N-acetylneuraminate lyase